MTKQTGLARFHFEEESYNYAAPFIDDAFTAAAPAETINRADVIRVLAANPDLMMALVGRLAPTVGEFPAPGETISGLPPAAYRAAVLVGVEWAAWGNLRRHGNRTFVFSEPLTTLLKHTDFRVPISAVNLPFPAVYYCWLGAGVEIDNRDGTRHAVEGAYVFHEHALQPGERNAAQHSTSVLTSYVVTRDPATRITNALYFSLAWDQPEHVLDTAGARAIGIPDIYVPLANLVINSTLYLSSPEAETRRQLSPHRELDAKTTRNPKKLRRLAKERKRTTGVDYIYVGESVSVPTDGRGAPLTVHHWVRGHWKMQPHGPGLTERRALWIKPYERGKDLGEQIARRYRVT